MPHVVLFGQWILGNLKVAVRLRSIHSPSRKAANLTYENHSERYTESGLIVTPLRKDWDDES